MLDRLLGEFRQDVGEIRGVFLARVGVIVRAHFIEDSVDVFPGVFGGAFEHHVFEEMRNAVDLGRFVAASGVDVKPGRERMRIGICLGDDLQAVGKLMMLKVQRHYSRLQLFRPHRHDRKRPGQVRSKIFIHLVNRQPIDFLLDLIQRADSAAHEIIMRDRAARAEVDSPCMIVPALRPILARSNSAAG